MCVACDIKPMNRDEFGERIMTILNEGAMALMISLGHRAGLFDAMIKVGPSTSGQLARHARLSERYVREWLGAMVTGRVVRIHEEGTTPRYELPRDLHPLLGTGAGSENVAFLAQYVGMLGTVEDQVLECFRSGGGVPYQAFERFSDVMAQDSGQSVVSCLTDKILPLMPGIRDALLRGIRVLDVGCGRGMALNMMARMFPNSTFVGLDLLESQVEFARAEAARFGSSNIHFEARDLSGFDLDAPAAEVDLVTAFDAIHDQAWPNRVLKGICKALKPDGVFLMQDIDAASSHAENRDHPLGPFLYTVSTMHCMTVSLAQGGMGLGTMWGRELAQRMLREAGFRSCEIMNLAHDIQNCYYIVRK
jgi:2-polyprenyl-3-methyl-5-hydroxy-6-metoxy-1,4-benzoquinol methylase